MRRVVSSAILPSTYERVYIDGIVLVADRTVGLPARRVIARLLPLTLLAILFFTSVQPAQAGSLSKEVAADPADPPKSENIERKTLVPMVVDSLASGIGQGIRAQNRTEPVKKMDVDTITEVLGNTDVPLAPTVPPAVAVQTSQTSLSQGEQITATLVVSAADLNGVDLTLTVDDTLLQLVPTASGNGARLGPLLHPEQVTANDITGNVLHVAYSQTVSSSVTGAGVVATFSLQAKTGVTGTAALTFAGATLYDGNGGTMAGVTLVDDSVEVLDYAILRGVVRAQGRLDHSGIQVAVYPGAGNVTTTDPSGTWTIPTAWPSHQNHLYVHLDGYLDLVELNLDVTAGATTDVGTRTLTGGDATGDQIIDIRDLSLIGNRFGSSDAQADINGDGTVNVLDLTLAAGNYGTVAEAGTLPPDVQAWIEWLRGGEGR